MHTLRRCQPHLGTLVEVRAGFADDGCGEAGMGAAFAAAARVHALMSFHDPGSDLSRINRDAAHAPVQVDSQVADVLRAGLALSRASAGVFDFTIGRQLVQAGLLPAPALAAAAPRSSQRPNYSAVELGADNRVRLHAPVWVDLGGIAKGYAVDCMVQALLAHGAAGGCVNAGGDLRLFGDACELVHVRDPAAPGSLLPIGPLRDMAVASSGDYFRAGPAGQTPLIDPRSGRCHRRREAVTVLATSCIIADALTKVVSLLGPSAAPILQSYGARAYRVGGQAEIEAVAA